MATVKKELRLALILAAALVYILAAVACAAWIVSASESDYPSTPNETRSV